MGFMDGISSPGFGVSPAMQEFQGALKSGMTVPEYRAAHQDSMIVDTGDKQIDDMAQRLNVKLTDDTKDYLMQYYLGERSQENAFNRSMEASNTQYQRAVKDLQRAGISPFLAFQGLSGSSPTSSGNSSSGGYYTSNKNNQVNAGVKAGSAVLAMLAVVAAAVMKSAASASFAG